MVDALVSLVGVRDGADIALLAAAALLGGLIRGFTGFGFSLVFVPIASIVVGPAAAVALIWAIDAPFAAPLAVQTAPKADWREVLPLLSAATLCMPLGVALLVVVDPLLLRWLFVALAIAGVGILAAGWRYRGAPSLALSLGAGAASGLANGLASLGGLPLVIFWLGGQKNDKDRTRSNLVTYFGLAFITSGIVLWASGLLTLATLWAALPLMLPYGLGLAVGSIAVGRVDEATFRRVSYVAIVVSAIVAMPAFDGITRR